MLKAVSTEQKEPQEKPLIGEKYLAGDLVAMVLTILRNQTEIWNLKPKREQQEERDRVTHQIKRAVREAVAIIAGQGCTKLAGTLDGANLKPDGIKLSLTIAKNAAERHALFDIVGGEVLVVLPQYSLALEGTGARDKPQTPQAEIPLATAGTGEAPEQQPAGESDGAGEDPTGDGSGEPAEP